MRPSPAHPQLTSTSHPPVELTSVRHLLATRSGGDLGTLGEQLRALAVKQMAAAARTHKHTPLPRRSAIPDYDWWQALIESVGLEVPPAVPPNGRHVTG